MQKTIYYITKTIRFFTNLITIKYTNAITIWKLYSNNVVFKEVKSNGIPFIMVAIGGQLKIGEQFRMNNGLKGNPIGRPQKCVLFVDKNAKLLIGDNVGISSTAIVASKEIVIGNDVKIGGGVCIYDTDFHSLNFKERQNSINDLENKISKSVIINDNVFIGAHSTILKGVIIGKNSVIGACSVVTKNIPPNEIWAGNPIKFIKKL